MVDVMTGPRIFELPLTLQINLRGRPQDQVFHEKVQAFLGAALPGRCGQVCHYKAGRIAVKGLWLAPDEWLIVADFKARAELLAGLETALAGCHHAVVDVSANRQIIALEGAGAVDVLAQGCSLDFEGGDFPPGTAVQTRLARTQAIIEQVNDRPLFHLYVRRSFAEYLVSWLAVAVGGVSIGQGRS